MIDPNHPASSGRGLDPAAVEELRSRFHSLQEGERAARDEARRLAHELALNRRLLKFHLGTLPPTRQNSATPTEGAPTILLSEGLICHLDKCENQGAHTAISGWAFRPAPGWDARVTTITLLLRHEDTVYMTACRPVPRPDVAAFYARQPPGACGGAAGLEGAGFACEVRQDALPAGTEWKIVLRLECRQPGVRTVYRAVPRFLIARCTSSLRLPDVSRRSAHPSGR